MNRVHFVISDKAFTSFFYIFLCQITMYFECRIYRIGGVTIGMLASLAVDHEF